MSAQQIDTLPADGKRIRPRVARLDMSPGRISAGVAGGQPGECDVQVDLPVWQDGQWTEVFDLLSRQALYAAQMLAGDFPDELELILHEAGLTLLPAQHETVRATCSCRDSGEEQSPATCPHITAVLHDAGKMLAEDPWLLFLLRGRVREQVLRALRRKRRQNGDANGAGNGGSTPQQMASGDFNGLSAGHEQESDDRPLDQDLQGFWGSARTQEEFRPQVVPPLAELILLRRLGPPAFSHANTEVYDTLAGVYGRVTGAALALAYAEDSSPESIAPDIAARNAGSQSGGGEPWDNA